MYLHTHTWFSTIAGDPERSVMSVGPELNPADPPPHSNALLHGGVGCPTETPQAAGNLPACLGNPRGEQRQQQRTNRKQRTAARRAERERRQNVTDVVSHSCRQTAGGAAGRCRHPQQDSHRGPAPSPAPQGSGAGSDVILGVKVTV